MENCAGDTYISSSPSFPMGYGHQEYQSFPGHSSTTVITGNQPVEKRHSKISKRKMKDNDYCFIKKCKVCGDHANSSHFGAMCCDSCKAFFRRSVQADTFPNFKCYHYESCKVSKDSRKKCQYCRFKKCTDVGMKTSLVMSPTERINLWRARLSKYKSTDHKEKPTSPELESKKEIPNGSFSLIQPQNVPSIPSSCCEEMFENSNYSNNHQVVLVKERLLPEDYDNISETTFDQDSSEIHKLKLLQQTVYSSWQYTDNCKGDSMISLGNVIYCTCSRLYGFFTRIEDFHQFSKSDQMSLLKNGISMALYVHGVYMFDAPKQTFPAEDCESYLKIPSPFSLETVRQFSTYQDVFDILMNFYFRYSALIKDDILVALMSTIALFSQCTNIVEVNKLSNIQSKYIKLLRRYLVQKEGINRANALFKEFLEGVHLLKEIGDYHRRLQLPTIPKKSNSAKPPTDLVGPALALTELMKEVVNNGNLPQYSTVLLQNDFTQSLQSTAFQFPKPQFLMPYHPVTCALTGRSNVTDSLTISSLEKFLSEGKPLEELRPLLRNSNI